MLGAVGIPSSALKLVAMAAPSVLIMSRRKFSLTSLLPLALAFSHHRPLLSSLSWPLLAALGSTPREKLTSRRLVVITGCDSGLGYSLSRQCQQLGLSVVAGCLSLESEGAVSLADSARVIKLDVTNPGSVISLTEEVHRILLQDDLELHAVVNNAGVMVFGEFEWLTEEQILQQIGVNQLGSFRVARAFLPLLRKHTGRLINVTSHCASSCLPGLTVYGASKAAVQNWSEGLRVEQSKYGVKVITFIPGSFFGQSNIMSRQGQYANDMKSAMSSNNWEFFGDYFTLFNSYLQSVSGNGGLVQVDDDNLYKIFTQALLSEKPNSCYVNEPWRYYMYYRLFKVTPTWLRDILVEKFVCLPKYPVQGK